MMPITKIVGVLLWISYSFLRLIPMESLVVTVSDNVTQLEREHEH